VPGYRPGGFGPVLPVPVEEGRALARIDALGVRGAPRARLLDRVMAFESLWLRFEYARISRDARR